MEIINVIVLVICGMLLIFNVFQSLIILSFIPKITKIDDMNFKSTVNDSLLRQILSIIQMNALETRYDTLLNQTQQLSPYVNPQQPLIFTGPDGTVYTGKNADDITNKIKQNPDNKLSDEQIEKIRKALESFTEKMDMEDDDEDMDNPWRK